MAWSRQECLVFLGATVAFIATLLILILVPLHFSYIERQHIGFKKNTVTNEVDTSTVYGSGTHAWGVGKTAVQFPSSWQFVSFRGSSALSFFTDAGEIDVEVSFYYRIRQEALQRLYQDFGLVYNDRVISIAQAELRNAATNFTTRQYQEERTAVANGLYDALAATLPSQASVSVNRNFFFLERIRLPSSVLQKRQEVFANTQLQITQEFNRTATQTRLTTRANETSIRNEAEVIRQNATVVSERLREAARANAFKLIQRESGTQLVAMLSQLGVSQQNTTDLVVKFNALLNVNVTLLSGVRTSVLKRP